MILCSRLAVGPSKLVPTFLVMFPARPAGVVSCPHCSRERILKRDRQALCRSVCGVISVSVIAFLSSRIDSRMLYSETAE